MKFKRLVWWIIISTTMLLFPIAAPLLLYFPPIQNIATQWCLKKATEFTGVEVKVKEARLTFPLRLEISDLHIGEQLYIAHIDFDILLRPLIRGAIRSSQMNVRDIRMHTATSTRTVEATFSAKQLKADDVHAFWREGRLYVHHLLFTEGDIALSGGDASLLCHATDITLCQVTLDTTTHISAQHVRIGHGALNLERDHANPWQLTQLNAQAEKLSYAPTGLTVRVTHLSLEESHGIYLQNGMLELAWYKGQLSIPSIELSTAHSTLQGHLRMQRFANEPMDIDGHADLRLGPTDARLLAKHLEGKPIGISTLYSTDTLVPTDIVVSAAWEGTLEQLRLTRCLISLPTLFDITLSGMVQNLAIPQRRVVQGHFEGHTYDLDRLAKRLVPTDVCIPSGIAYSGVFSYTPDTLYTQCKLILEKGTATLRASYQPASEVYYLRLRTDSLDIHQILPRGEWGSITLDAHIEGHGMDHLCEASTIQATLQLHSLQWRERSLTNSSMQASLSDRQVRVYATCNDPQMQWKLKMRAYLTPDTTLFELRSGDLSLTGSVRIKLPPWRPYSSSSPISNHFSSLRATLSAGEANPVSKHLHLAGLKVSTLRATISEQEGVITGHATLSNIATKGFSTDSLHLSAHYSHATLRSHLHTTTITWSSPQMHLQGKADASLTWSGSFHPDSLRGILCLSSVHYSLPTYSLQLHSADTLHISFENRELAINDLPLYTQGEHPLLLDGNINFAKKTPFIRLFLTARDTPLLQATPAPGAILYGKALASGSITLEGPLNALSLTGFVRLSPESSIHYIYNAAILTSTEQLDDIVTFVQLDTNAPIPPTKRATPNNFALDLTLEIAPTVRLEASLGTDMQNSVALQGGGTLSIQHLSATGLRLSGSYTIDSGELNMNMPLLHASHLSIRQGSTVIWSGNPKNPLFSITAEDHIRASVNLDGNPQSVLFATGLSLTDTMEKPNVQFTLSAPENASMQNALATLSPEERNKLAIGLLTTGLYLGEGGTGNLMNSALMSLLQSQLDNISRDLFRTVDVSVGLSALPDGVSGINTRTDYSFSFSKRLLNNRLRIIIGASVTTNNEKIEDEVFIDNISIEWRISPIENQYLRIFYEKNYENILEGEIRETGLGYGFRRSFLIPR